MPNTGDSNPYVSPSTVERPAREAGPTVAAFVLGTLALVWIGGYVIQTGGSHIGLFELALLFIITVSCVVGCVISKQYWLLGLPMFFAIGAVCSPADPMSALAIAVPSCCVYTVALLRTNRQHA
jgi:hypothetical protein